MPGTDTSKKRGQSVIEEHDTDRESGRDKNGKGLGDIQGKVEDEEKANK